MATVPGRSGFGEPHRSTNSNKGRLPIRYPTEEIVLSHVQTGKKHIKKFTPTPAANSTVLPEHGGECELSGGNECCVHASIEDETAEVYVQSFISTGKATGKTCKGDIDESHAPFSSGFPVSRKASQSTQRAVHITSRSMIMS